MNNVLRYRFSTEYKNPEPIQSPSGEFVKFSDYEQLKQQLDAVVAECAEQKAIIDAVTDFDNEPQYHPEGMGCGLEDRGITDRYDAMQYGWEQAMERIYGEVIPCAEELNFPATSAALAEVEAKAALPANWDDLLFNEMNRRFELKRHDDDYLTNGDTQIGVEFAIEFIKQLREGRVPSLT